MKKDVRFKIKCELYKVAFGVIFTSDVEKTADEFSNDHHGNAIAVTIRYIDGSSIIIMPDDIEIDYPTLAHECMHAVNDLFDVRGIVMKGNDIEHFTYTVEWLMREIIKRWKNAVAKKTPAKA